MHIKSESIVRRHISLVQMRRLNSLHSDLRSRLLLSLKLLATTLNGSRFRGLISLDSIVFLNFYVFLFFMGVISRFLGGLMHIISLNLLLLSRFLWHSELLRSLLVSQFLLDSILQFIFVLRLSLLLVIWNLLLISLLRRLLRHLALAILIWIRVLLSWNRLLILCRHPFLHYLLQQMVLLTINLLITGRLLLHLRLSSVLVDEHNFINELLTIL